jgi:DNA (cytosine-5)-methyltransferase 1
MLRVIELFAGIGACSKALTNLGIEHEIVDAVEIDKYAIKSFNAIHGTNFEPQDITKWNKDIKVDLIMHGSPCQDFSIAGKQAGGDEGSGTRSSLLYETLRIVEKTSPDIVIWENVKNLLSKKHVHNWEAYVDRMSQMGYDSAAQVMNAKDYGIPQNRERVFTVSIKRGSDLVNGYMRPTPRPLERRLKDILEDDPDERYFLTDEQVANLKAESDKQTAKGYGFAFKPRSTETYATTISTKAGQRKTDNFLKIRTANKTGFDMATDGDGIDLAYPQSATPRGRVGHGVAKTIPTGDSQGTLDGYRIRKLTPRECWRLMGFDDADFDKAQAVGTSNTQLYKQAGNSIVVNCLMAIIDGIQWNKEA